MSHREICHEIEGMLPAYALGALDSGERSFVEAHLAECPGCQEMVKEYTRITEAMLHLPLSKAPPPGLRSRVESVVSKDSLSWLDRLREFWRGPWLARAAVGASIAALVLANLLLLQRVGSLLQVQERLQAQVDRNQTAMAVMSYPSSVAADVEGEDVFGTLVYDPERRVAVLYAWGLEPLPSGSVYQAWLRDETGERVSAGLFETEAGGQFSVVLLRAPEAIERFRGLGVTVEPREGSEEPTGPQVLNVDL
ncbi:MAG: anti-sigma factor domain-containing protein [Anaerolineales bacterium]